MVSKKVFSIICFTFCVSKQNEKNIFATKEKYCLKFSFRFQTEDFFQLFCFTFFVLLRLFASFCVNFASDFCCIASMRNRQNKSPFSASKRINFFISCFTSRPKTSGAPYPSQYKSCYPPAPNTFFLNIFLGDFFLFLIVQYSALFHLPPLRFHCADGCRDRTQDRCNWCIGSQTL